MLVRQAQQFSARSAGAGLFEHTPDETADAANERGARRRVATSARKTCRESMGTGSHDGKPWKGNVVDDMKRGAQSGTRAGMQALPSRRR